MESIITDNKTTIMYH